MSTRPFARSAWSSVATALCAVSPIERPAGTWLHRVQNEFDDAAGRIEPHTRRFEFGAAGSASLRIERDAHAAALGLQDELSNLEAIRQLHGGDFEMRHKLHRHRRRAAGDELNARLFIHERDVVDFKTVAGVDGIRRAARGDDAHRADLAAGIELGWAEFETGAPEITGVRRQRLGQ